MASKIIFVFLFFVTFILHFSFYSDTNTRLLCSGIRTDYNNPCRN
ncbi:hypothetical protein PUN28_007909 [Cardiocondyla obscurior]|uniref:Nodule Cysteine-Rich (NCR) secreted peptide n=1 Tax=Cardiocondyla obscurior TaxID=286306 RepID=A0AAW2FY65_9HYME